MSPKKRMRFSEIHKAVLPLVQGESKRALHTIAIYVDRAEDQWERTKQDREAYSEQRTLSEVHEGRREWRRAQECRTLAHASLNQELLDLHFYFICVDKVHKVMSMMARKEGTEGLNRFWKDWEPRLRKMADARQLFEHPAETYLQGNLDEALFGLFPHESKLKIGGKTFNLERVGFENLNSFFDDLMQFLLSPNNFHTNGDVQRQSASHVQPVNREKNSEETT